MDIAKLVQSITVSVMSQLNLKQNMNWLANRLASIKWIIWIDSTCCLCMFGAQFYLFIYFKYLYVSIYLLAVDLVSIFIWELKKAATTGSYKLIKFCKFYWSEKFFVSLL